ncbi:MAG: multicopper oxidase domain-containing protein, partial [Bacteroidota bacterium]
MKQFIPCGFLLLFLIPALVQSQETEFPVLERFADVADDVTAQPFKKLPELRAENGRLDVYLYIDRRWVRIGSDSAYLRSYAYRSGTRASEEVGPWGPTLRLGPDDVLNLRIINDLPDEPDLDYLGSVPKEQAANLSDGPVSEAFVDALLKANIYAAKRPSGEPGFIDSSEVKLDRVEVLTPGYQWRMHGVSKCKCPPEKMGTCDKTFYSYWIEKLFNPGSGKEALRVSEELVHEEGQHNHPHGFNTSNMHTHGWHVSPFQDDIFRKIPPQLFSNYFYELDQHAPGTFWYHPHVHGSTAIQVASGMSGALIVDDPDLSDFPALAAASAPEYERVLLINQVNYDAETLELQSFRQTSFQEAPMGTTINGIPSPEMTIRPGEVQRWRLIQSGHDAAVAMFFPKEMEVWQIAVDGIYLKAPRQLRTLHLAPGNRSDILVKVPASAPEAPLDILTTKMNPTCEYFPKDPACWLDAPARGDRDDERPEPLIRVAVKGPAAAMEMPKSLPPWTGPLVTIPDAELSNIDNPRKTIFNIQIKPTLEFQINGRSFQPDTVHEKLKLGDAEVWEVSSNLSW